MTVRSNGKDNDTMTAATSVVILGAGGLAREVLWVLQSSRSQPPGKPEVLGFIDDDESKWGRQFCGKAVLGDFRWLQTVDASQLLAISAVGSTRGRQSMVTRAERLGLQFCSAIHPSVEMSGYVDIGLGTTITAGCILTTDIRIGNHVFLNLDTTVGHDVVVEDYVNVAPGCHISGSVVLREGADLGTGAVVLQGITIGRWSVVGAGAVVINDVPDGATVVGVPAKVIKGGCSRST